MKIKNRLLTRTAALLLAIVIPAATNAHDMWFELKDFKLSKGSSMECYFPSDHVFPSSNKEYVPAERVAASYIVAPSGAMVPIVAAGNNLYRSAQKLSLPGTHLAVTGKQWTYWVKTTEGYIEGKNKSQVKNALQGIYSAKFSKAVIIVDKPGGNVFSKIVGHELEIIPLKDPGTLVKGDTLPVKVLLQGKPAEMEVKATYDGYSSKSNVFAEKIKTDQKGMGEIKINKKGKWLIQTSCTEKAADNRFYDEKMYAATLAFQIR
ncbi:MAG TPA: DUF4198 domain-containing protein [Spirochaetota bacterium]|nr:DUF4198 domain-containing protein [Spirochaetota bacterium]